MNKLLLLFSTIGILIFQYRAYAQKTPDYKQYYLSIIDAEETFVDGRPNDAFQIYDKIFESEEFKPFVFDLYNAAQFAYISGDTARFLKYITYAARNGMPEYAFYAAPIFRKLKSRNRKDTLITAISDAFKDQRFTPPVTSSELKIMNAYSDELDSLHRILGNASAPTIKCWVKTETDFRKYLVKEFLSKGKFPSEKIVGLIHPDDTLPRTDKEQAMSHGSFTVKSENDTKSPMLVSQIGDSSKENGRAQLKEKVEESIQTHKTKEDKTPLTGSVVRSWNILDIDTFDNGLFSLYSGEYAPFLHYSCTFKKYHKMLWQAVLNGYLPPKEYAMFEEANVFKAFGAHHKNLSVDYCDYEFRSCYYNILDPSWYPDSMQAYIETKEGRMQIEENRKHRLIRKYATELKMKSIESTYGLKLFFGFFNYR